MKNNKETDGVLSRAFFNHYFKQLQITSPVSGKPIISKRVWEFKGVPDPDIDEPVDYNKPHIVE